jgi:hypothetical protein
MSTRVRGSAGKATSAAKKRRSGSARSASDAGAAIDAFARTSALLDPAKLRGPAGLAKAAAALREARHSGEAVGDPRFAELCVRAFSMFPDARAKHPEAMGTLENEAAQLLLAARWPAAAAPLCGLLPRRWLNHGLVLRIVGDLGDRSVVPVVLDWFEGLTANICDLVYYEVLELLVALAGEADQARVRRALAKAPLNRYQRYAYEHALDRIAKGEPHRFFITRVFAT